MTTPVISVIYACFAHSSRYIGYFGVFCSQLSFYRLFWRVLLSLVVVGVILGGNVDHPCLFDG